jgi:hypothetical protein
VARVHALSASTHRYKSWRGTPDFRFAALEPLVDLGMSEIARAALHLPLAFIRQQNVVRLIAMTSIEPGRNHFVGANGQWLAGYLPFQLRSYPFVLAPSHTGDLVLCIVESSGLIVDSLEAQPFFEPDGSLHPRTREVMETLVVYEREKAASQQAANELDGAGLVKPWEIMVPGPSGPRRVEGLLQVDEAAFAALDDAAFLSLRRNGGLTMAYCQMLSMQNLSVLVERAQVAQAQAPAPVAAPLMELDFSRFAG